jgi:hypothetical protein
MNRYVITYFSDPSENTEDLQELNTIFIEGLTEDDARDKFYGRIGSFSQIVSCDLTKSCGGPGSAQASNTVSIGKNVTYNNVELEEVLPSAQHQQEVVQVESELKQKKIKVVNRSGKISNASLIRQKIAEAKAAGQDKNFVIEWAVETLGQTRPVAKSYVKNIWSE